MSFEAIGARGERFALRGHPQAIALTADGLRHPWSPHGRGGVFTPYEELTHVALSRRTLWLGTRRSVYALSRRAFVDPSDPERLVEALLERVARRPGGAEQLARMARIEATARAFGPLRVIPALAGLCLAVAVLQLALGSPVYEVGYFSWTLVLDGDLWRMVTANLLHAFPQFPLHLVLNLLGLFVLGALVERPLGAARTVWILGASAFGAMAASGLAGYAAVVGVSGVVFGLGGSVLWLELRVGDQLPAWCRFPRKPFYFLLAANAGLMLLVPLIAGAAHVGGFAAGFGATAAATGVRPCSEGAARWVRGASGVVALLVAWAVLSAGGRVLGEPDFAAHHAARLARLPGISPVELNDRAWMIAISPDPTRAQLEAALQLAERAVRETQRSQPALLDTLAELQFLLGAAERAIETIDEAIARAPGEPYYREQRRRFIGERPLDDRPPPPSPFPSRPSEAPPTEPEAPGPRVGERTPLTA